MRALSMQVTHRAMLSRAQAGIYKRTLIVNLPGSRKAVEECLSFVLPELLHGIEILREGVIPAAVIRRAIHLNGGGLGA